VLVDGTQVAANWTALVSGTLDHPIDKDASGTGIFSLTLTGTNADGTATSDNCAGWSSTEGIGTQGFSEYSNSTWSNYTAIICDSPASLYCFQQ
jgi:hypothetical protein